MIDEKSLEVALTEMQKKIVKELYKKNDLTLNEYNAVISKLDKKIMNIKKKSGSKLEPITIEVKI